MPNFKNLYCDFFQFILPLESFQYAKMENLVEIAIFLKSFYK